MCIGAIVIIDSQPPHIGSVTEGKQIICEDGSLLPIDDRATLLFTAMEVIKQLEGSVLNAHEAG